MIQNINCFIFSVCKKPDSMTTGWQLPAHSVATPSSPKHTMHDFFVPQGAAAVQAIHLRCVQCLLHLKCQIATFLSVAHTCTVNSPCRQLSLFWLRKIWFYATAWNATKIHHVTEEKYVLSFIPGGSAAFAGSSVLVLLRILMFFKISKHSTWALLSALNQVEMAKGRIVLNETQKNVHSSASRLTLEHLCV